MGKGKRISSVMINLELEKLKAFHRELCSIRDIEVGYSADQLEMANEAIRKMKSKLDYTTMVLWNMLNPNNIDDGSSGLE